jgi:hypothetical protein
MISKFLTSFYGTKVLSRATYCADKNYNLLYICMLHVCIYTWTYHYIVRTYCDFLEAA